MWKRALKKSLQDVKIYAGYIYDNYKQAFPFLKKGKQQQKEFDDEKDKDYMYTRSGYRR